MQINFLDFFKSEKFNKIFNISLLVIFAILTFVTMINHELWRDEAQAWLVVRDLNLLGIIDHVKTEGHPLLWYAVLFPFAKMNVPVFSMQVVSFLLSLAAAFVFLFYSPFNKFTKTAVLFSSGFVYWYSVISRSYSLIPVLIFLCAIFYPKRFERPYIYTLLLILLSNTHVLMFGFCAAAAVFFVFEILMNKEKIIAPAILFCVNFFSIVLYLAAGRNENALVQKFSSQADIAVNLYQTLISVFQNIFGNIPKFFCVLFLLFVIILITVLFKNDKKIFSAVTLGILFQFFVYRYIWVTSTEKAFLLLLILLFGCWAALNKQELSQKAKNLCSMIIAIFFLFTWPISFLTVKNDIKLDYSGSKKAAEFIKNNIPPESVIVSNYNVTTAAISAYLPGTKFYFPQEKSFYTYSKWNNGILAPYIDYNDFFYIFSLFKGKKIYYIFSYVFEPAELEQMLPKNLVNVYKSQDNTLLQSEKFYIYELKNDE